MGTEELTMTDELDTVAQVAKHGGSAGAGAIVIVMLQRIFGRADKDADKTAATLEDIQRTLAGMSSKFEVMLVQQASHAGDLSSLRERVEGISRDYGQRLKELETAQVGDIAFNRQAGRGEPLGWVCTVSGTDSTYAGGLTATTNGSTTVTLSGANHVTHGIQNGDRILIAGTYDRFVVDRGGPNTTTITVDSSVPAGAAQSIAYVSSTWARMPRVEGGAIDSSGTPGNVTQNGYSGQVAFAIAGTVVVITNSLAAAGDYALATLQTADGTLTSVSATVTASTITLTGNAAATGVTKCYWKLEKA